MKRKIPKSKAPNNNQELHLNHLNNNSINSLSDFNLKVKIVFNLIDKENRIPQLYCMRNECMEEGRPHIAAYIDNRIAKIREGFAV